MGTWEGIYHDHKLLKSWYGLQFSVLRLWHLTVGLNQLRSVSNHGAIHVTHEPPSAMKGRLVAEAFFPGQPPPLPAVLGRTLFAAMGPLRLQLRVIDGYACLD